MSKYIKNRANSFKYAWQGIVALFAHEPNARIHLSAAMLVVLVGSLLELTSGEWCAIALSIGGVFMAEAFNTAIEKLCDKVSPERDPLIKTTKDVAAGAVLLFVLGAVAVGLIIFIPKIKYLLADL